MRYRSVFTFLLVVAATGSAQDRMADTLRKGVVEEESKQNLGAAIQDYETVLAQFNDARQTAATALFRMAECYRKQGSGPQAIAAYQRVVREFADQGKLAEQSRGVLTGTYHKAAGETPNPGMESFNEEQRREIAKQRDARARYRSTIEQEMELVRQQIGKAKQHQMSGIGGDDVVDGLTTRLIQLERELAAFDAGMPSPRAR
jgi:tetratricopeptide (TPR) repeat protein